MNMPYTRAPHRGDSVGTAVPGSAPNAALLIDFDNVTMGMRSDLSRDLKKLLESDVIRGKVTVQRAYADWRRYPQYIVPLSENSIDLIFAPAYGSSKKNATDIRMAIDAVELVFVRPEIGTFILLTGDSDFSSCVLKLKEYGKYVIGVGIEESSSDILVQNCDEYYSYTSLTGLTKTTDGDQTQSDPWVLVEQAVKRMVDRDDVMRSDRLKQVMMELDGGFDEGKFGFSKFSRFLSEAASRGLLVLSKLENGQYEIEPGTGSAGSSGSSRRRSRDEGRSRRSRRERDDRRDARKPRDEAEGDEAGAQSDEAESADSGDAETGEPIAQAFGLTVRALEALREAGRTEVRDSDVKRRMLELDRDFDEGALGFSKFSRFLQRADEEGVIVLTREDGGNYSVSLPADGEASAPASGGDDTAVSASEPAPSQPQAKQSRPRSQSQPQPSTEPIVRELRPEDVIAPETPGRRLGPRGGTTRRRDDAPPALLPGQAGGAPAAPAPSVSQTGPTDGVEVAAAAAKTSAGKESGRKGTPVTQPAAPSAAPSATTADDGSIATEQLGLPTDATAQIRYLSNSYRGVGRKTAEALVEQFGERLFEVLRHQPDEIRGIVPAGRADSLLDAWNEDLGRRLEQAAGGSGASNSGAEAGEGGEKRRSSRGGRRGRGGRGRG